MRQAFATLALLTLITLLAVVNKAASELLLPQNTDHKVYCERQASLCFAHHRDEYVELILLGVSRPAYRQHADMARYVVHSNTWGSVASFSQHLEGFPFA